MRYSALKRTLRFPPRIAHHDWLIEMTDEQKPDPTQSPPEQSSLSGEKADSGSAKGSEDKPPKGAVAAAVGAGVSIARAAESKMKEAGQGKQAKKEDAVLAAPVASEASPVAPRKPKRQKSSKSSSGILGLAGSGIGFIFSLGALGLIGVMAFAGLYLNKLTADLPDYEVLADYQPPVTTRVYAGDGSLVAEFARERRLFVPIDAIPTRVKSSFVSAEDKSFYEHSGLDMRGIVRAQISNFSNILQGRRLEGGSTITQQVAKNFLLTSEQKIDRKLKEWLVTRRIENAFTKDQILELYLNEIYLGNRSYGVAAAALNYFDKSLDELDIHEAAYLAAIPKGPSNYHPVRNRDRAIERRDWVIGRIADDGHITPEEASAAQEADLGLSLIHI